MMMKRKRVVLLSELVPIMRFSTPLPALSGCCIGMARDACRAERLSTQTDCSAPVRAMCGCRARPPPVTGLAASAGLAAGGKWGGSEAGSAQGGFCLEFTGGLNPEAIVF